jgi:hypothetical protein
MPAPNPLQVRPRQKPPKLVIPGRRAAASPESIFQWPVFLDSGLSAPPRPGMTNLVVMRVTQERAMRNLSPRAAMITR